MPVFKKDIIIQGQPIWLGVSYGEVVGQQKWNQTEVSGNAYSISSQTHENLEFWIREKDGQEKQLRFTDMGISVRPGQKIWMAWGGKTGEENGDYLFGANLSENSLIDFKNNKVRWGSWWQKTSSKAKSEARGLFMKHWIAWGLVLNLAWWIVFSNEPSQHGSGIWAPILWAFLLALLPGLFTYSKHWDSAIGEKSDQAKSEILKTINEMVTEETTAYQAHQQKAG